VPKTIEDGSASPGLKARPDIDYFRDPLHQNILNDRPGRAGSEPGGVPEGAVGPGGGLVAPVGARCGSGGFEGKPHRDDVVLDDAKAIP
jgi:hypothetical protein